MFAVLLLLERMKRLATWAELLTLFRSTAAPVTTVCVSRDDKAHAHGHVHHAFTGRTSGHVRRPIVTEYFPPRMPLLVAEVAERVQVIRIAHMSAITHGNHVVLIQLTATQASVLFLIHTAAAAAIPWKRARVSAALGSVHECASSTLFRLSHRLRVMVVLNGRGHLVNLGVLTKVRERLR